MPDERNDVVTDSPTGWVAKHVRRYVESDGKNGHQWRGVHTLLLTTRGRSTGKLRRTALIYGKDGDRYLVVASNGGSKPHPDWYQNLAADPHVSVQVGDDTFEALASTATPRQKPRRPHQGGRAGTATGRVSNPRRAAMRIHTRGDGVIPGT